MDTLLKIKLIDVQDFGVPQKRKRLVLIASRLGGICHPSSMQKRATVRDAIAPSIVSKIQCGDLLHNILKKRSPRVMQIIQAIPKDGGSRVSLPSNLTLDCHKQIDGFRDVYGRMKWDAPSPTITSGCTNPSKGRFLHPEEDRAITLREAALLQTFPIRYKFGTVRSEQAIAQMIGNALPPLFAKYQALAIKKHLIDAGSSEVV